jgi:hypothetical protein
MAGPAREKLFLGIAEGDREPRAPERVAPILERYGIQALTFQRQLDLTSVATGFYDDRRQSKVLGSGKALPFQVTDSRERLGLVAVDTYLHGSPTDNRYPEYDAGIRYALTAGIPFYFIEGNINFPNHFFAFADGHVRAVPFEASPTGEGDFVRRKAAEVPTRVFIENSLPALNLITAAAVNRVLDSYDRVAHMGGIGRFDAAFVPEPNPFLVCIELLGERSDLELSQLVKADIKERINLSRGVSF